jgi:hypothetical protein
VIGATALDDLVARLAWSLLFWLRSKGLLTTEEVAGELEDAVSDVDGIRSSASLEEVSSCLREMLTLLRENPDATGSMARALEP